MMKKGFKVPAWVKGNESLLFKSGLVIAGYLLVIHPLLKSLGVIQSAEDKAQEKAIAENSTGTGPFNPNYYKNRPVNEIITKAAADAYAKKLYGAIGYVYDDESVIYGVFRQMNFKATVSWIAERFYALYGEDLYNYLARSLNASEMTTINQIVNNLK